MWSNYYDSILHCRLLGVLILLTNSAFIIAEVFYILHNQQQHTVDIFQVIDLIFAAYYCAEVSLRIVGNGCVLRNGVFMFC